MTGMVTYAGLDVHARSTHGAAFDVRRVNWCAPGSGWVWRSRSRGLRVCLPLCAHAMRPSRLVWALSCRERGPGGALRSSRRARHQGGYRIG